MNNKYFSKEEALQKAKQYCAYQERCHSEIKEFLKTYKVCSQSCAKANLIAFV